MENIAEFCIRHHGIVTTAQLNEIGYASRHLTALVRSGTLRRIRQGWYATKAAHPDLVRAIRVGGRLAGVSAAAWYGLATPLHHPLHVHVPSNAARLRSASNPRVPLSGVRNPGVVTHWGAAAAPTSDTRLVVSLHDCLRQVLSYEHEDDAVACIDSALHQGRLDRIEFEMLRSAVPASRRRIIDLADARSEVYPESITRRRLARAGIPTRIQVWVLDERRIDLLIGDRLALEIDGMGKYLSEPDPLKIVQRFEEEKQRDAFLVALGFIVIHITYEMLMNDWDATLSMIRAVMERGDHLHRPGRRYLTAPDGESLATRRPVLAKS